MKLELASESRLTSAARRVARQILENGPASVAELCEQLNLTPTAVRRPLELLESEGVLEAHERAPFGPTKPHGRGRPAKVYSLTPRGREAFDQSYDDVAIAAIKFIESLGGEDAVANFAKTRVDEFRARLDELVPADLDTQSKVAKIADALSDQGYAATVTQTGELGVQLCQHHCPIAHVATEFPVFCEAETQALSDALEVHVTRLATIGAGDGVCTTHIPLPELTDPKNYKQPA
ncbi:MAG: metalloregulator ArsR/SmtB family transcription factor [Candidatus Nanopelagicales bacterium]